MSKCLLVMGIISFTVIVVLGYFRLQPTQLEQEVSRLDGEIERYSMEERRLEQDLSKLTSIQRVYEYCKVKLGMSEIQRVEAISVPPEAGAAIFASEVPSKGWRSSAFPFLNFIVN